MKNNRIIENLFNKTIENEYIVVQDENFSDINDDECKELEEVKLKISTLEKQLFLMLPEEGRELYFELESQLGNISCIESRYMFKKGVVAGLTNLEYLKEVNKLVYLPLIKL